MHKTKEIIISGNKYLAVEVPHYVNDFEIIDNDVHYDYIFKDDGGWANIPIGNYEIIGLPTDEEVAKKIVRPLWNGYLNYLLADGNVGNYHRLVKETAVLSLKSALEVNDIYFINPINKPVEDDLNDSFLIKQLYFSELNKYEEAQEKVWENVVLLKILENSGAVGAE